MQVDGKIIFFALILTAAAFEIVGDVLFKKWALENKTTMLLVGFAIYFIGTVFWALSLKFETMSKSIAILTILNLVIIALIGIIVFKEDLTLWNKAGIALGVLSIMLIEL